MISRGLQDKLDTTVLARGVVEISRVFGSDRRDMTRDGALRFSKLVPPRVPETSSTGRGRISTWSLQMRGLGILLTTRTLPSVPYPPPNYILLPSESEAGLQPIARLA